MKNHSVIINNTFRGYLAFLMTWLALFLSGCEENDNTALTDNGLPLQISASIQSIDENGAYKFNGGQSVGLWVSSVENASLKQSDVACNIKFYQSAGGLVSEPRTYWGEHQQLNIYGYYPFDTIAVESPEAYHFSVELEQKGTNEIVNSDLLWTNQKISLNDADKKTQLEFQHLMSKLVINVRGLYPDAGTLRECTAKVNALYSSIVNFKEGVSSATGNAEWLVATSLVDVADNYESSMQVILPPQTIGSDVPFLKIITKGNVENEWVYFSKEWV